MLRTSTSMQEIQSFGISRPIVKTTSSFEMWCVASLPLIICGSPKAERIAVHNAPVSHWLAQVGFGRMASPNWLLHAAWRLTGKTSGHLRYAAGRKQKGGASQKTKWRIAVCPAMLGRHHGISRDLRPGETLLDPTAGIIALKPEC